MKKIFITILCLLVFIPKVSSAAEIFSYTTKSTLAEKEKFLVEVFLDTEDSSVNAVEGVVTFPSSLIELKETRDGNSLINFWVEKPHITKMGEVSFSGITSGGFVGKKIFLFSMVFETKVSGKGTVSFKNIRVLNNDGLGTEIVTTKKSLTLSVGDNPKGDWVDENIKDTEPPEVFIPVLASDIALFDGATFVVFSTVDKGSGVDHYAVKEGRDEYIVVTSPYVLKDQSLSKNIYVTAFDKSGNERTIEIKGPNRYKSFQSGLILGIILIICIFLLRKKFPNFLK
jgi:hypothetical protein